MSTDEGTRKLPGCFTAFFKRKTEKSPPSYIPGPQGAKCSFSLPSANEIVRFPLCRPSFANSYKTFNRKNTLASTLIVTIPFRNSQHGGLRMCRLRLRQHIQAQSYLSLKTRYGTPLTKPLTS